MNFDANIACLIGLAVAKKISDKENCSSKKMRAPGHQSCREPEVVDGIASDEMSKVDFDEWFKQESHKLFCPQKLVSSDVGGLHIKAIVYFGSLCCHNWDEL